MTRNELSKLVLLGQEGDRSALGEIYMLTYNSAFNKICSAIDNEDDVEDVLQDCYVSMISNLGSLKEPQSFEKWFNTIIANKIKDYKKKKSPVILDENEYNALSNLPEDNPDCIPHESIERTDNIEVIRKLVSELSDKNRQSIEMHYFENKSISEIADELDISENTVKARLYNARNEIKQKSKLNTKKILITILIIVLLAVITVFTVSSTDEIFSKILYKFHNAYGESKVDSYYLDDYPQTIEEFYTLSYIPKGFELYEIYMPEETQIYYETYLCNETRLTFKQCTLNRIGSFDNENSEVTTEIINGFEVMCLKNHIYSLYSWNNENYTFSLNISDGNFPREEAVKIIEGIIKKDSSFFVRYSQISRVAMLSASNSTYQSFPAISICV